MLYFRNDVASRYSKLSRFDILAVHMRNALMVRELHLPQPLVRFSVLSFVLFFFSFHSRSLSGIVLGIIYFRRSTHVTRNIFATGPPCRTFIFKDPSEECVNGDCVNLRAASPLSASPSLPWRGNPLYALAIDLYRDRLGLSNLRSLIYAINILCAFA